MLHTFNLVIMRKTNLFVFFRPAALLRNSTSNFYSLCKATGKAEFAILRKLAGV